MSTGLPVFRSLTAAYQAVERLRRAQHPSYRRRAGLQLFHCSAPPLPSQGGGAVFLIRCRVFPKGSDGFRSVSAAGG